MGQTPDTPVSHLHDDSHTHATMASRLGESLNAAACTLAAGGVAGAVSRTLVAPVERVKILFQVQGLSARGQPLRHTSLTGALRSIWQNEGVVGLFKGNGANVLRILPMSGLQFLTFDLWVEALFPSVHNPTDLAPGERLVAGALAGATAQTICYPLDLMRARLTTDMRGRYHGLFAGMVTVAREEGVSRLYRGLVPSLAGIIPYIGIDFAVYGELRKRLRVDDRVGNEAVMLKLLAGAVAGVCGWYPSGSRCVFVPPYPRIVTLALATPIANPCPNCSSRCPCYCPPAAPASACPDDRSDRGLSLGHRPSHLASAGRQGRSHVHGDARRSGPHHTRRRLVGALSRPWRQLRQGGPFGRRVLHGV